MFYPKATDSPDPGPFSKGTTDANGTYTLVTRDGAVVHKDVKAEEPAPAKPAAVGAKKGAGAKKTAGAAKTKAKKE